MAAQMQVVVETRKRWWLFPSLFVCNLLHTKRFHNWLFAHGFLVRVKIGSVYIDGWRSVYQHYRDFGKVGLK